MAASIMHSAKTNDWGTPRDIVELARTTMGHIGQDPCSSEYWNTHVVEADVFFDDEDDALNVPADAWGVDTYIVNPPSGLVKEFWDFAVARWQEGSAVFFVGFSLNQMTYLGKVGLFAPQFVRCVPFQRTRYLESPLGASARLREKAEKSKDPDEYSRLIAESSDWLCRAAANEPPHSGDAPPHGSYLALLPNTRAQIERFRALASAIGAVF